MKKSLTRERAYIQEMIQRAKRLEPDQRLRIDAILKIIQDIPSPRKEELLVSMIAESLNLPRNSSSDYQILLKARNWKYSLN